MNYYIADTHFGHRNVIQFDNRPFSTVEEMDNTLIQFWNARVRANDHVYIIGDFAYKSEHPEEWYLRQLGGHKHLMIGNHDRKLLQNQAAMNYFDSVDKMMHVTDDGNQICVCHFPVCEWNGYHKGHLHIYGHIHNHRDDTYCLMRQRKHAYNAGCMLNNYMPVTLKELIQNNQVFQSENG